MSAELVARRRAHDELVVDVEAARRLHGKRHPRRADPAPVARRVGATPRVSPFEGAELHSKDGSLELVQARVQPRLAERECPALAVAPEPAEPRGERTVTGRHHASIPVGAEVLRRVEAEAREAPERTGAATAVARAVCLGGILDHRNAGCEAADRRHVGALPVEMHRDHRARPPAERPLERGGRQGVGRGLDVGEDGARPHRGDGHRGRRGAERRHHHLVPRPHVERPQRQLERGGGRARADHVPDPEVAGELRFEARDLLVEDVATTLEDAAHGSEYPCRLRAVPGSHVVERGARCLHR